MSVILSTRGVMSLPIWLVPFNCSFVGCGDGCYTHTPLDQKHTPSLRPDAHSPPLPEPKAATEAGSMRPTGMLSCFFILFIRSDNETKSKRHNSSRHQRLVIKIFTARLAKRAKVMFLQACVTHSVQWRGGGGRRWSSTPMVIYPPPPPPQDQVRTSTPSPPPQDQV